MGNTKKRFLEKVDIKEACWIWMGAKRKQDYGYMKVDGKNISSHRLSYQLFVGEIPEGMCVCHRCDTPPCVNPNHLFLGTSSDNVADKYKKGRAKMKLTSAEVSEIRSSTGTLKSISEKYGVSVTLIHKIRHNQKRIHW